MKDALAYYSPEKPPPPHVYKTNAGRDEITRNAGGPNKDAFFRAWLTFAIRAQKAGGSLHLRSNVSTRPVMIAASHGDSSVSTHRMGSSVHFGRVKAIAVVPAASEDFDVKSLPLRTFIQIGNAQGATNSFEGGGDGTVDRLSRSSSAKFQKLPSFQGLPVQPKA